MHSKARRNESETDRKKQHLGTTIGKKIKQKETVKRIKTKCKKQLVLHLSEELEHHKDRKWKWLWIEIPFESSNLKFRKLIS